MQSIHHACHNRLQVSKVSVPDEGLFYMHSPDPDWRNKADCGMAQYKRADGSTLPLNCAGPSMHTSGRCMLLDQRSLLVNLH